MRKVENLKTKNFANKLMAMILTLIMVIGAFSQPISVLAQENKDGIEPKVETRGGVGYTITETFPDANMAQAIADILQGTTTGEGDVSAVITQNDINSYVYWNLSSSEISNISGVEHFTSLKTLYLSNNQISDVSPLAGLTSLTELHLPYNQISDVSPLAGLTSLKTLYLSNNQISDVSPLAGLTSLTDLYLFNNQISDVSPLAGLTSLGTLHLFDNQISDVSPLAGLTSLTNLYLSFNQISDVSPLAGLTSLTDLDLSFNQISDVSPLAGLTSLTDLYLSSQIIVNESKVTGSDFTLQNQVRNELRELVVPNSFTPSATYNGLYIEWTNLAPATDNLSYSFNTSVTIGSQTTTFSGKVYQPVTVVSPITPEVPGLPTPVLIADSEKEYAKGSTITESTFKTDVSAQLNVDGSISTDFNEAVDLTTVGVYRVSLIGEDNFGNQSNEVVVSVLVTDETTIVVPENEEMISAKNFEIALADVAGADFVAKASAQAWNTADGSTVDVSMTSVKPTTIGVHAVTFETASGSSITIYATVTDETTIIVPENEEMISAKNFEITLADVAGADFKTLASAQAWNTADGSGVEVTLTSAKPTTIGVHAVTFETEKGTSKTVLVLVTMGEIVENGDYRLISNNFEVTVDEVAAMDIETLSGTQAWNAMDLSEDIEVTFTGTVPAQIGVYAVNVATATDPIVSKTIYVTVTDETTIVVPENDEMISAKNFEIALADVAGADFKTLASAQAWNTADGSGVEVTLTSAKPTTIGVHAVTFETEKGTLITVKAFVTDENTVVSNTYVLYASDFTLVYDEKHLLDTDVAKVKANVVAYEIKTGEDVSDKVVAHNDELENIVTTQEVTTHPLTFTVTSRERIVASKTIDVTIINNSGEGILPTLPVLPSEPGTVTPELPQTGDASMTSLFATLLAGSGFLLLALKRKKQL